MGSSVLAAALLGGKRRQIRNPFSEERRKQITEETRYIFNITDQQFGPIYRTWGVAVVKPCSNGELYARTAVHGRVELLDTGMENTYEEIATLAEAAAEDITGWCNENLPRCDADPSAEPFAGVFWGVNPEPDPGKLKEAEQKLRRYFQALVREADSFWGNPVDRKNISAFMRRAGTALKLERPWLYEAKEQVMCPACGSLILPGVAVCRTCNAVVDEDKARKFFPERFLYPKAKAGETFSSDVSPAKSR